MTNHTDQKLEEILNKVVSDSIELHETYPGPVDLNQVQAEAKTALQQLIREAENKAECRGVHLMHQEIFDTFDMLEKIQPYYEGNPNINAAALQVAMCDFQERIDKSRSKES